MKEQGSSPEEELNEVEISNLSDIEFRIMIIRMLNSMRKDIETIKKTTENEECTERNIQQAQ